MVLVDVAAGSETCCRRPTGGRCRAAWLPDGTASSQRTGIGRRTSSQVFLVSYPSGSARRITNDLRTYSGLSVAPDGQSFVGIRNERRSTIWTMPLTTRRGCRDHRRRGGRRRHHGVAWTPDGRIVYTTEASGNPDIWIMNADGIAPGAAHVDARTDVSPRVTRTASHRVRLGPRRRGAGLADGARWQRREAGDVRTDRPASRRLS